MWYKNIKNIFNQNNEKHRYPKYSLIFESQTENHHQQTNKR